MLNKTLALFASLLVYPTPDLPGQVEACIASLKAGHPEAADRLVIFQHDLEHYGQTRMEEIYTRTFDMQPVCFPYVGFQLFGESYKRGAFMAKLVEGYRDFGYAAGEELPDHAAVVLRFLSLGPQARDGEFGRVLFIEGLLPALRKMAAALQGEAANPYGAILSALLLVLEKFPENERAHA